MNADSWGWLGWLAFGALSAACGIVAGVLVVALQLRHHRRTDPTWKAYIAARRRAERGGTDGD